MGAGVYNFEIEQGTRFTREIIYKTAAGVAINVNGYSANLKVRKSWDSANAVLAINNLRPTGPTGGITVGTTDGKFTVVMTQTGTANLDFDNAVYDFEIAPSGGSAIRLLKGVVTLSKEVTK